MSLTIPYSQLDDAIARAAPKTLRLPRTPFDHTARWITEHLTERILHKTRGFDTNASKDFNESGLQILIAEVISYAINQGSGGVPESIFLESTLKENPNEKRGYKRPDVLLIAAILSLIELKMITLISLYEGTLDRTITQPNGQLQDGEYTELRQFYDYLISIPSATWEPAPLRRVPTVQQRAFKNAKMAFLKSRPDKAPKRLEDFYYRYHLTGGKYQDQSVIGLFHQAEKQVQNYASLLEKGCVSDTRLTAVAVKEPVKMDIYTTVCLGGCRVVAHKLESRMSRYTVKERK